MTALSDFMTDAAPSDRPQMVDGRRWVMRSAQTLGGTTLVLAALGLWVLPGASWDADLLLIKLGLSLFLGFAGIAIMQMGRARPLVQVEIDTTRREVRLVRLAGRVKELVDRTAMSDLGGAAVQGGVVSLFDAHGDLIADVALTDPQTRKSVLGALRDAGKL
ncbi:hypothetical protein [uncultured Tateyamaria sp.]|uniref:hypothetical protein n=1 Tax=Tateyamaria sp. TaxID=1929288 RepID=UPI00262571FA|nr:hypothetical protein [uncultured Tateyamaria sp.]